MASGPPYPPPYDPNSPPYRTPPAEPGAGPAPGEVRWLAPATLPQGAGHGTGFPPGMPAGGTGRTPLYELRPLSTGEVLDRTFSLYRSRFPLFAGIAALSALVRLVGQAAQLGLQNTVLRHGGPIGLGITSSLLSLAMSAVFLLALAVTQAATVWAVGEVYLGRDASVTGSVRATVSRWLRYVGIAFWQLGSAMWPVVLVGGIFGAAWSLLGLKGGAAAGGAIALLVFAVLGALVVGLIFYLRNLLAVPAAVREGLGVRASMRRSKVLSQGAKGKLFLVLLIAAALYFVMGILLVTALSMTMLLHRGGGQGNFLVVGILTLVVVFAGYTLISPVVMIGVTLVYVDQRVRVEAFDVAVLLGDESAPGSRVTATPQGYGPGSIFAASANALPGAPAAEEPLVEEPPGGAAGL